MNGQNPVAPSLEAFLATTMDAALVVQAAVNNPNLRVPRIGANRLKTSIRSGWVFVYRASGNGAIRRRRDGLNWSDRRAVKGFQLYRELSDDQNTKVSAQDIAQEQAQRQALTPYLGPHIANDQAKRRGLVKKTIVFDINGEKYGIAAYYTVDDVLNGTVQRPRHLATWNGFNVSVNNLLPDFWNQRTLATNPLSQVITIINDGGMALASNGAAWAMAANVPAPVAVNALPQALAPVQAPVPVPAPAPVQAPASVQAPVSVHVPVPIQGLNNAAPPPPPAQVAVNPAPAQNHDPDDIWDPLSVASQAANYDDIWDPLAQSLGT
ncbi:hypothetical protein VTJ49DRAFT_5787 [Mycothermus thermophilus]|uniref:Uncharacterized protein n=1 Tax=Humicola insolens TaxID=85995 RepID=A0ABR3VRL9_HUMIN